MQALIASPPDAATHKCANCKNPMLAGQEWCLECGAAASRAPGRRAGLRSGAGVAALTVLFVCGAVGASYAALAPTKKHTLRPRVVIAQVTMPAAASGIGAVPGAPTVAPGTSAPLANVPPPTLLGSTKVPKLPKVPVTGTPSLPAAVPHVGKPLTPAQIRTPKHTTGSSSSGSNNTTQPSGNILLDTSAATTFNPSGLPVGSFGDPARAVDGETRTAWTYTLDPARSEQVGAGLVIDLKRGHRVSGVTLNTPSPGIGVEIYGSSATRPTSFPPAGSHLIGKRPSLKDGASIPVKGGARSFRYILIYIVRANRQAGSVGISEVSVQK